MNDLNLSLNTCYVLTGDTIRTIAYYSHLIPIFFTLSLSFLVFFKTKYNTLSKIFLAFSIAFSFWLLGDLITWVSNNYYLVYAFWSPLDYLEVIFFTLGLYFAVVFVRKTDISSLWKIVLFGGTLIPLVITLLHQSVTSFDYVYCEAIGNTLLSNYKLYLEIVVVLVILGCTAVPFVKKGTADDKKSHLIVLGSMFLFLTVFGVTSYLASVTAYYEMNLYALFVIPIFLIAITYGVFTLDIFNLKTLGTYFLVFGFIILTASQMLFITDTSNKVLLLITIVLSIILSLFLFKNLRREFEQRLYIEKLLGQIEISNTALEKANHRLKDLDRLKTEFLSLASHQLRSPLTAIKGYTSMLLDGSFGEIKPEQKEAIDRVYQSSQHLTKVVGDLLNVSKIEQGGMQYQMEPFDLAKMTKQIVDDFSINAKGKGLEMTFETDQAGLYILKGDAEKIRQIVLNFIDNAIKYTQQGWIKVKVEHTTSNKIRFSVSDSGMGMTQETIATLFQKFSRGEGGKVDTGGSGLGLYLAKQIVEAHHGKVWVESDGPNKGSTFFAEFDL